MSVQKIVILCKEKSQASFLEEHLKKLVEEVEIWVLSKGYVELACIPPENCFFINLLEPDDNGETNFANTVLSWLAVSDAPIINGFNSIQIQSNKSLQTMQLQIHGIPAPYTFVGKGESFVSKALDLLEQKSIETRTKNGEETTSSEQLKLISKPLKTTRCEKVYLYRIGYPNAVGGASKSKSKTPISGRKINVKIPENDVFLIQEFVERYASSLNQVKNYMEDLKIQKFSDSLYAVPKKVAKQIVPESPKPNTNRFRNSNPVTTKNPVVVVEEWETIYSLEILDGELLYLITMTTENSINSPTRTQVGKKSTTKVTQNFSTIPILNLKNENDRQEAFEFFGDLCIKFMKTNNMDTASFKFKLDFDGYPRVIDVNLNLSIFHCDKSENFEKAKTFAIQKLCNCVSKRMAIVEQVEEKIPSAQQEEVNGEPNGYEEEDFDENENDNSENENQNEEDFEFEEEEEEDNSNKQSERISNHSNNKNFSRESKNTVITKDNQISESQKEGNQTFDTTMRKHELNHENIQSNSPKEDKNDDYDEIESINDIGDIDDDEPIN